MAFPGRSQRHRGPPQDRRVPEPTLGAPGPEPVPLVLAESRDGILGTTGADETSHQIREGLARTVDLLVESVFGGEHPQRRQDDIGPFEEETGGQAERFGSGQVHPGGTGDDHHPGRHHLVVEDQVLRAQPVLGGEEGGVPGMVGVLGDVADQDQPVGLNFAHTSETPLTTSLHAKPLNTSFPFLTLEPVSCPSVAVVRPTRPRDQQKRGQACEY